MYGTDSVREPRENSGMSERLQAGDPAPDFTLPSDQGPVSLQDHRGSWVVLYFYPKDFTSGCTQEACDFRDAMAAGDLEATVLGVSMDDVASHAKFKDEHGLDFPLLADENHEVSEAYGAYGNKGAFGWGIKRSTFVIDPEGDIAKAYYNVRANGHVAAVASDLASLKD